MVFLVTCTVLNLNAKLDINESHDKLIIDLSDGYHKDGYYYLPVADNVTENYYVGMYKIGFLIPCIGSEHTDLFVETGSDMILNSDIYKKMIKIKYKPDIILFNGIVKGLD